MENIILNFIVHSFVYVLFYVFFSHYATLICFFRVCLSCEENIKLEVLNPKEKPDKPRRHSGHGERNRESRISRVTFTPTSIRPEITVLMAVRCTGIVSCPRDRFISLQITSKLTIFPLRVDLRAEGNPRDR